MSEKPDFTKIEQTAIAASLAILSGLGMRYISALQGNCTPLNLPCDILIVIFSTILFVIFLRVVKYMWDAVPRFLKRFSRKFKRLNAVTQNKETKPEIPKFYTHTHHAEFIIKDSNADEVAKFILQYLDDIPWFAEGDNFHIITNGGAYYSPEKHGIPQHAFVASGEKTIARHGYRMVSGMKMTADPQIIKLPEMFFITVVQGGQNTTKVKFDADDKDAFSAYSKGLLKQLREVFNVTNERGLLEEQELVKANIKVEKYSYREPNVTAVGVTIINLEKRDLTDISIKLIELKKSQFETWTSRESIRSFQIGTDDYDNNFDLKGDFRIRRDDKRTIRLGKLINGEFFFLVKEPFSPERLYQEQNTGITMNNAVWELTFELQTDFWKELFYTRIAVTDKTLLIGEIIHAKKDE